MYMCLDEETIARTRSISHCCPAISVIDDNVAVRSSKARLILIMTDLVVDFHPSGTWTCRQMHSCHSTILSKTNS